MPYFTIEVSGSSQGYQSRPVKGCTVTRNRQMLLVALAAALQCFPASRVRAAEPSVATVMVQNSDERIVAVLSRDSLPRELSIDAFSAAEQAVLKEDMYRETFDVTTGRERHRCAGWLFLNDANETRLVGVQISGFGMVKVNGHFRAATITDSMYVSRFQAVEGIRQAIQVRTDWIANPGSPWVLVSGGIRRVDKSDQRCTLLPAARCRRYTFEGAELAWNSAQAPAGSLDKEHAAIRDQTGRKFRFVVEDMCPATRAGMVEGAKIGRLGDLGDQLSSLFAGFYSSKSLKEALKQELKK